MSTFTLMIYDSDTEVIGEQDLTDGEIKCIGSYLQEIEDSVGEDLTDEGRAAIVKMVNLVNTLEEHDPTPWCHFCGAMEQKDCGCPLIPSNH